MLDVRTTDGHSWTVAETEQQLLNMLNRGGGPLEVVGSELVGLGYGPWKVMAEHVIAYRKRTE